MEERAVGAAKRAEGRSTHIPALLTSAACMATSRRTWKSFSLDKRLFLYALMATGVRVVLQKAWHTMDA